MSYYISGKHIYLREVRLSDVNDRYYSWLNDPEVNQFLETRYAPRSLENIAEFVRSHDGKSDEPFFAVCLNKDDSHIGNIKVGPVNWIHRNAAISLLIGDKGCWGKGYATEAIALIVAYSFNVLNLNKVHAGAYVQNVGSIRAFERNGFRKEGLLEGHVFHDGQETDVVLLGLRAADYRNSVA